MKQRLYSRSAVEKTGQLHVRVKLGHFLTPYTKVSAKWVKDLKVRPDTVKQHKTGRTLFEINHTNSFMDLPPRVMTIKINKWDLTKLRSFCTGKEIIKKDEKTTYRMGENMCKGNGQQGINLQNIQIAHEDKLKKKKRTTTQSKTGQET